MINVAPFDDCIRESHMHVPWHECTLQHVTPDRAWIWVIPFGNQAGHVNRLTSVGLTLDPRLHGKPQLSPETEFRDFVGRFPSLHRQFEGATAARPWVSTSRLQYSTHQSIGNRYCLMSSAAGFVDPIFSKGLENTFQRIIALVEPLLRAFAEDDFASHRFSAVEEPHQTALNFNDRLANCTFSSWDDHDVWDAWVRIVALGTGLIEANLALGLEFYAHSANPAVLRGANESSISGSPHEPSGLGKLFDESMQTLEAFQANQIAAAETTEKLWKTMARYRHLKFPFPHPAFQNLRWALTNPGSRDIHYNGPHSKRWYARIDDPHLKGIKA
jgi:FADH2 O2-dependent halogenase